VDYRDLANPLIVAAFWHDSPIPKAIVSREGIIEHVNDAWFKLLGYSYGELVGKHFREITHPADLSSDENEVKRLISNPDAEGYSLAKRYISKRGAVVWVELHVAAIRTGKDEVDMFAVSIIPLPDSIKNDPPKPSVFGDFISRVLDIICKRPREFLVFALVALVAIGRLPADALVDFIKSLFLPK
jgi:PAS domain S-box-containing protein